MLKATPFLHFIRPANLGPLESSPFLLGKDAWGRNFITIRVVLEYLSYGNKLIEEELCGVLQQIDPNNQDRWVWFVNGLYWCRGQNIHTNQPPEYEKEYNMLEWQSFSLESEKEILSRGNSFSFLKWLEKLCEGQKPCGGIEFDSDYGLKEDTVDLEPGKYRLRLSKHLKTIST